MLFLPIVKKVKSLKDWNSKCPRHPSNIDLLNLSFVRIYAQGVLTEFCDITEITTVVTTSAASAYIKYISEFKTS